MLAWALLAASLFFAGSGDAHVLDVPYRSQLDGSAYAWANCGPTSLSMALAYYGIDASPWDLRVRAMKAQHTWVTDEGGYSDENGVFVYILAAVATQFGLHPNGLWDFDGARTDRLHQWRPNELRNQVQAGHPVIVEVAYRALPVHAGSLATADHYIVLDGTIGTDFVYNDPLGQGTYGPDAQITAEGLMAAMAQAAAPDAAFAIVKPVPSSPRADAPLELPSSAASHP
jgi:hypothetical protein